MPKPFDKLTAIAAPIMRTNIDTDVIIRIERLVGNGIRGTLGKWAFGSLRYLPDGSENPEFILNREPYRNAEILITGPNFGCGSSREGAVWSLQERGIRAIVGSSFGDIFFANCFQNGILPIMLDKAVVDALATEVEHSQGAGRVSIDLEQQTVTSPNGTTHHFKIDPRRRDGLLRGLDEVMLTLQRDKEIRAFQAADSQQRPWIHFARTQA
jgi:3-isopropylmalate/(R)-2-methylmalate dehydratase small subunit